MALNSYTYCPVFISNNISKGLSSIFSVAVLSLLLVALPAKLKADITFDVNLTGTSTGVDGFSSPQQFTVDGTITVDPDLPVEGSNFASSLTFTSLSSDFLATPFSTELPDVTFNGDTASNLDFVVVDSELFIRRIGTEDSQLTITNSSAFSVPGIEFGSGQFSSTINQTLSFGFLAGLDQLVLRESGGIDTDNGIGLNATAVPEPTTSTLLGLFIVALGVRRKRP